MNYLPLRTRVRDAFIAAGGKWPLKRDMAIPLGGAALQCKTLRTATLVCDVLKDQPELMRRNARLMTFLCSAAGWPEPTCDQWIAQELRAVSGEQKSVKTVGKVMFTLSIDYPPRLIVLHVQEKP